MGGAKAADIYRDGWVRPFDDSCDDYSRVNATSTFYNDPYFVLEEYNGSAWEVVCEYTNATTQDSNTGIPCGGTSPCGGPTNTYTNTPIPPTNTPTNTFTNTVPSNTFTDTVPPTSTFTNTYTHTATNTYTYTHTFTNTPTATPTATFATCAASDNFNDNSFDTSLWTATDLGAVSNSSQSETSSALSVSLRTSSGMNSTDTTDNVRFIYQKIPSTTDFIMKVRLTNINGGNPAGGGVVVRDSLNAGSEMYFMGGLYYDNPAYFKYRNTDGGSSSGTGTSAASFSSKYFMLVKNGDSIGGYYSTDNVTWTPQGVTQTASFDSDMYVGLDTSSAYSELP
ncbi:MAG TPA: hypothetical protein PKZ78_12835, partial [Candidatus Goldiibacteriota bacterium]|nr:hypothetical protein [Candidatus Goldiibacteriota bacterium]